MPANASATACDAVGRAIENDGIVLHVPAPGTAVSGEAESLDGGAEFMIATAVDGTVSYPEKDSGLLAGGRVSGPGPCSDGAYNLLYGHGGNVEWYLGDGKRPAGLTTSQTADVLNDAANNITRSYTNCPDLTDTVSATEKYLGVSSHEADMHIDSGDTVCDFWDDGQNVVDFGDLAHNGDPWVGYECNWYDPMFGLQTEADIKFNTTDWDFTTTPNSCLDKFDLESVATHEFGHAFLLGHVSEQDHPLLTMSRKLNVCDGSARTLGLGDIRGLRSMY